MQNHSIVRARGKGAAILMWCALAGILTTVPSVARAQYNAPPLSNEAVGEKYHVELAFTLWNPTVAGVVASEQFGQNGTKLDFLTDLGFQRTRFKDLRAVLRPGKKHKLRMQYTPIVYEGATTLSRDVVFNGIKYPISLPITSEFGWKVLRLSYEYDALYRSRGFVGVVLESRFTEMVASLESNSPALLASEFTSAKAPLPALGVVGRGYVTRNIALDFEMTGFRLPNVDPDYVANYFDWDVHGTVNFTNNAGIKIGWRRMTTDLQIKRDSANFIFEGTYFGGVVRF